MSNQFSIRETEIDTRFKLQGDPSAINSVLPSMLTFPGSLGIQVEDRASIHVPKQVRESVAYLLKSAGWVMLALALLILPVKAWAFCDDWRTQDTVLEASYWALHIVDWGQTRYIAQHPDSFYEIESAWAIGKHPSVQTVDSYMLATGLLQTALSCAFTGTLRTAVQVYFVVDTGKAVLNNNAIGIKIAF